MGGGFEDGPDKGIKGGDITPDLIKSAKNASETLSERVSPTGPSSATTRSLSVIKMVSPDSASLTYALSLLLRVLIPTDLIFRHAAASRYFNGRQLMLITIPVRAILNRPVHKRHADPDGGGCFKIVHHTVISTRQDYEKGYGRT